MKRRVDTEAETGNGPGANNDASNPTPVNSFTTTEFIDTVAPAIVAGSVEMSWATDKTALLPDRIGTFAAYTTYDKGINGLMVDLLTYTDTDRLDLAEDFEFRVGNSPDANSWAAAPAPIEKVKIDTASSTALPTSWGIASISSPTASGWSKTTDGGTRASEQERTATEGWCSCIAVRHAGQASRCSAISRCSSGSSSS